MAFVLVVVLLAGIATCAIRLLGATTFVDRALVGWVATAAAAVLVVSGLSIVHWVRPASIVIGLTVVGIALAVACEWRSPGSSQRSSSRARRHLPRDRSSLVAISAAGVGLAYTGALALGTAPNTWDSMTYHLARIGFWHQMGGVGWIENAYWRPLNAHPPVAEILQWLSFETAGHERAAWIPQLVATLVIAVGITGIAQRVGIGGRDANVAAALFVTLPIVLMQSGTTQNDLIVASFLVAAAYGSLGVDRRDHLLVGAGVALAVGTKLTALFGVVVITILIVAAGSRARRSRLGALAAGFALGSGWYVVNLAETGNLLGRLPDRRPVLDLRENVITAFNLVLDSFDLSGAEGRLVFVYGVTAVALVCAVLIARGRGGWPTALAAGAVALTPFLLFPASYVTWRTYQKALDLLGQPDVPLDDDQWKLNRLASDSYSWFGPLGAVLLTAALVAAVQAMRRREVRVEVVVLAAAPVIWLVLLSASIAYDPFRGRFFVFPLALSASTWGLLLRREPVRVAAIGIAATTACLCLVYSFEKPLGVRAWGGAREPGIWGQHRWEVQSRTRSDVASALRAIEELAPAEASVALALGENDFGYPFFGPRLKRTVTLVAPGMPETALESEWLVVNAARRAEVASSCWAPVVIEDQGLSVFSRRADTCSP